jgi:hypothetical protein
VNDAIKEEIVSLDIEKVDFDDKKATKDLFLKLLCWIIGIHFYNNY